MKYLITTARSPSQRTRTFVKDLVSVLPNAEKISRGKISEDLLGALAADVGADRVLIVKEKYGNPSSIEVYKVEDAELKRMGKIVLSGISLSAETGRRVYNVKKLCLEDTAIDEETREMTKRIAELLGIPPCEGDESLRASVERGERGFELSFRPPGSKARVGPVLRIRDVEVEGAGGDNDS